MCIVKKEHYGVTIAVGGTVLGQDGPETVVQFDIIPGSKAWYSGATEFVPWIAGAKVGDRIILEYVYTKTSGLWRGRLEAFRRAKIENGPGYVHVKVQECPIGPKRKQ